MLALVDADRKVLLREVEQVERVDAGHGHGVREEGQRRAGRRRGPASE